MNKVVVEKTDEEKLEECSLKLKKLMNLIKKDNCGSKEIKDANFFVCQRQMNFFGLTKLQKIMNGILE